MRQKVNNQNFWLFINKLIMGQHYFDVNENIWMFINELNMAQKNLDVNEEKRKRQELLAKERPDV